MTTAALVYARMAQEGDAISAKLANDATGRSPG